MKTLILSDIHCMTHLFQEDNEIVSIYAYTHFLDQIAGKDGGAPINRLILSHTHRQAIRYLSDELLWLNPGSASYRRRDDPDQRAHYAVIVDGAISLRRLAYDLTPLRTYVANISLKAREMEAAQCFFAAR